MEIIISAKVKGKPVEERYEGKDAERAEKMFDALYPSAKAKVVRTIRKGSHLQIEPKACRGSTSSPAGLITP